MKLEISSLEHEVVSQKGFVLDAQQRLTNAEVKLGHANEELYTYKEFSSLPVREFSKRIDLMYKKRIDQYETRLF